MQRPVTQTPTTTQSDITADRAPVSPYRSNHSVNMAAMAQRGSQQNLPHTAYRDPRPTLPPIHHLDACNDRRMNSPLTTPPISRASGQYDSFQRPPMPPPSPSSRILALSDPGYQSSTLNSDPTRQESPNDGFDNPLKRPFGIMTQGSSSYSISPQTALNASPTEPRSSVPQTTQPQYTLTSRNSYSETPKPGQTHSMTSHMGQGTAHEARSVSRDPSTSRLSLHIRQQPRAARAGPDGKDRRAIDPPPVLQLLIDDFDLEDEDDMNELRSSYFVVHCRLVSADSPKRDLSTLSSVNEDGSIDIQRLLLGTTVSSPFFCQNDPDPDSMPLHPVTSAVERPPSPTSRFIQSRNTTKEKSKAAKPKTLPGSFFIFADLSVRKAGEYRLEFGLMKIDAQAMITGKTLPILHTVVSSVFRVVNAKDFDQVQPSTELVKGLLDRGAGFPLKLKKGIREGQRRKTTQTESDSDDDDDDDGV